MESRPRISLLFILLLTVIGFLFFLPILAHLRDSIVGWAHADVLSMFYPLRAFANQELRMGRLPLWNPFVLCGHPFHAEGQGAIFYPVNLALAGFSAPVSMNLFALIHFIGAGVFFYAYLRACALRPFSAFIGAFVYMLSSVPVARLFAGHFTIVPFLALIPAMLWAWQAWLNDRKPGALLGGALGAGGMILAGYPQLLFYFAMYLSWLAAIEAIAARRRRESWKRSALPFAALAAMLAMGAALGAIQLFSTYAFAKESFRQEAPYAFAATFSFPPENLITLLAPRFFGGLGTDGLAYWGRAYLWEMWIYIGIVPLAMAVLAIARHRSRLAAAHATAIVVFLILALGRHTPLHQYLYEYMPFFGYFRGSSKFSFVVVISLAALSAMGVERLVGDSESPARWRNQGIATGCLAIFAAIGVLMLVYLNGGATASGSAFSRFIDWRIAQGETQFSIYLEEGPDVAAAARQAAAQCLRLAILAGIGLAIMLLWPWLRRRAAIGCLALAFITFGDLWLFSTRELPTASPRQIAVEPEILYLLQNDPASPRVVAPSISRNAFMPHRIETILGYVGNLLARYNNFLTAATGVPRTFSMAATTFVTPGMFYPNTRYLITGPETQVPPDEATALVDLGGQILYRLRFESPKAYFSPQTIFFTSREYALEALESGRVNLAATDMIEVPPGVRPEFLPPQIGDTIEVIQEVPREVLLHTSSLGPRLLILTDAFASGWQCTIDGQPTPIYPANVAFRAVQVPSGQHDVRFHYRPAAFRTGAITSAIALAALMLVLAIQAWRRGRAASPPPAAP